MSDDRGPEDVPADPAPASAPAAVQVENADTVNVAAPAVNSLPHFKAIIAVTFLILGAFAAVTFYVLVAGEKAGIDAATKGAIIQTWNNLAIAAATFWVGSSLAGKMSSGSRMQ